MKKVLYVLINLNLILGHMAFAGTNRSLMGQETYNFVNEKNEDIARVTCPTTLRSTIYADLNNLKTDGKIVVDSLQLKPKVLTLVFPNLEYDINLTEVNCKFVQ